MPGEQADSVQSLSPPNRCGVLLAGGSGTRLMPLTGAVNKHLLPVYDKPMIFYPLSLLMLAGIREVVVVSGPGDIDQISGLLGDGSRFGISLHYVTQPTPDGIAGGLSLCRVIAQGREVMLVLGDNILLGRDLGASLKAIQLGDSAQIFTQVVDDPTPYAVVVRDDLGDVVSIIEKPPSAVSFEAVPGLYLYPSDVFLKIESVEPSARGEREITDLNRLYLEEGRLLAQPLSRGSQWVDAGTVTKLHEISTFVKLLQDRQGTLIASPEEIAARQQWITKDSIRMQIEAMKASDYGRALARTLNDL
jgi:glucose-1-phosphate thymidylyltransferase